MADFRARCLCHRWPLERIRFAWALLATLSCTSVWASARTERQSPGQNLVPSSTHAGESAIDFRCDGLEVRSKPEHRQICRGHVILRREDLILCCNTLCGESDADWTLEHIICTGDVRVSRAQQTVWAEHGRYDVLRGEIVLRGTPLLDRAGSQVRGEQVTINLNEQQARVVRPRGQIAEDAAPQAPQTPSARPRALPALCPIGPRPKAL